MWGLWRMSGETAVRRLGHLRGVLGACLPSADGPSSLQFVQLRWKNSKHVWFYVFKLLSYALLPGWTWFLPLMISVKRHTLKDLLCAGTTEWKNTGGSSKLGICLNKRIDLSVLRYYYLCSEFVSPENTCSLSFSEYHVILFFICNLEFKPLRHHGNIQATGQYQCYLHSHWIKISPCIKIRTV